MDSSARHDLPGHVVVLDADKLRLYKLVDRTDPVRLPKSPSLFQGTVHKEWLFSNILVIDDSSITIRE